MQEFPNNDYSGRRNIFVDNQKTFDLKKNELTSRLSVLITKLKRLSSQIEMDTFTANLNVILNQWHLKRLHLIEQKM